MSQYTKTAVIELLQAEADKATTAADAIVATHLKAVSKRGEARNNDISLLEQYFEQTIRELRKGVTKEARRRISETYKDGSAKPLVDAIMKSFDESPPVTVAPLRAKAKSIENVIKLINAAVGDSIALTDLGRLGALKYLPVLEK